MDMLDSLLDILSSDLEYEKRFAIAKVSNSCVWCGEEAVEFRDASAKLEYFVSALCQRCQDEFIDGASNRASLFKMQVSLMETHLKTV